MLTPPPMVPIMKSGIIPPRFAPENKFIGLTYRAFIWVPYKMFPLKDLPGKSLRSRDDFFHSCRDGSPFL